MASNYNLRSPAVKRLMKEAHELREPTEEYFAQPLEDNLFEWHFTVKGPSDSDFDDGYYHGRIILPTEYPMKPPSIIILTPNGRFETNKKICLSISGHHPESWQPSWSIRTALLAIIGFMPTESLGAIGSLNYSSEERKALAVKSHTWQCPTCGNIKNLLKETKPKAEKTEESEASREAKELAKQICFKGTDSAISAANGNETGASVEDEKSKTFSPNPPSPPVSPTPIVAVNSESETIRQRITSAVTNSSHSVPQHNITQRSTEQQMVVVESSGTRKSTYCVIVLTAAIAFLVFRRLFLIN